MQNARSIYGAVQQLILAARAFGVGTSLTLLHAEHEDGPRGLLGLPDDRPTMGLLPLGYPARRRWAQPERRPVEEVVHWNRWRAAATAAGHPRQPWRRSTRPSRLDPFAVVAAHNREIWTLTGQRPANGRAARNWRSGVARRMPRCVISPRRGRGAHCRRSGRLLSPDSLWLGTRITVRSGAGQAQRGRHPSHPAARR
jgi:hypothetical protein